MLETLKALADPTRLRLMALLAGGELTVQELTVILAMGQSRVSRHLKILADAGILQVKRQGTWSYYRLGSANAFFSEIRPALERGFDTLPQRAQDLAAKTEILDRRRRRSLDFFSRHAREWDALVREALPLPAYLPPMLRLLPPSASLLEVGVGTGRLLVDLGRRGGRIVAVDHAPEMLEEARRRLAEVGLTGVELRLGEMSHLPLGDGEVQAALLNMVLHHAAEPEPVLAELRRVLAAGGTLVVADLVRHEREWVRERLADQWLGFETAELAGWLRAAGFVDIRCETVPGAAGEVPVLLVAARKPGSGRKDITDQDNIEGS